MPRLFKIPEEKLIDDNDTQTPISILPRINLSPKMLGMTDTYRQGKLDEIWIPKVNEDTNPFISLFKDIPNLTKLGLLFDENIHLQANPAFLSAYNARKKQLNSNGGGKLIRKSKKRKSKKHKKSRNKSRKRKRR